MSGFCVQRRPCSTCIYSKAWRRNGGTPIATLEAQVADRFGGFSKHRQCHHTGKKNAACCRGFWNRHKNNFAAGQIAQRLGVVEFVDIDAPS